MSDPDTPFNRPPTMPRSQPQPSRKPFAESVLDLAEHVGVPTSRRTGQVNITALWEAAGGLRELGVKETLYKMIAGDRSPSMEYIEKIARGLDIDPDYFVEWRLFRDRSSFDPDIVGLEAALEAHDAWSRASRKLTTRGGPAAGAARR